jgi:hypothetical protein
MLMKIKYNHWFAPMIPFYKKKNWVYGKAIFGNLYFSEPKEVMLENEWLLRHELTHIYQQREDGLFWIKYVGYWVKNIWSNGGYIHQAYLDIPYEVESREQEEIPLTAEEWELFYSA